jgi:imidazolonepropionase-like amidohydrolase
VDHIKLSITGGLVGPPWDNHRNVDWLDEELEAAFAICRQRKMKVMVHAANPESVKKSIALGAWSIEHGYVLDDECIRMMVEHGTFYVPTLSISQLTPKQVTNQWERDAVDAHKLSDELAERADLGAEEHRKAFRSALEAGVKIANGSDSYLGPLYVDTPLEISLLVKCGATPMQAIMMATRMGAEVRGESDKVGTIEQGKLADLVLLRENPLDDINNIRSLEMVFKGGALLVNNRERPEAIGQVVAG